MERAQAAGRLLAERHATTHAEAAPGPSLLDYAESPRAGDWTLRSALVRLAQPQPTRVAAVLELVRRLDSALHPLVTALRSSPVACDGELTIEAISLVGASWELADASAPYDDTRITDLARIGRSSPGDFDAIVDAYVESAELSPPEETALPLLFPVLELDELAEVLVAWALVAPAEPPIEQVDASCRLVFSQLEQMGVPTETGPPPNARGRG